MTHELPKRGRTTPLTPAMGWVLLVIALALVCAVSTAASGAAPDIGAPGQPAAAAGRG